MATVLHSAPRYTSNEGFADRLSSAIGKHLFSAHEEHGEILLTVARDSIAHRLPEPNNQGDWFIHGRAPARLNFALREQIAARSAPNWRVAYLSLL